VWPGSGRRPSHNGGIARATLTKALNAGDRAAAADAFMNWLKPAALRARREAERDLFRHGRYPSGTLPVWAVDAGGRVDFSKPLRRLTESEALELLRPEPAPAAPGTATAPAPPETVDLPRWLARLASLFSQLLRRA
jgi:lysozyme